MQHKTVNKYKHITIKLRCHCFLVQLCIKRQNKSSIIYSVVIISSLCKYRRALNYWSWSIFWAWCSMFAQKTRTQYIFANKALKFFKLTTTPLNKIPLYAWYKKTIWLRISQRDRLEKLVFAAQKPVCMHATVMFALKSGAGWPRTRLLLALVGRPASAIGFNCSAARRWVKCKYSIERRGLWGQRTRFILFDPEQMRHDSNYERYRSCVYSCVIQYFWSIILYGTHK